MDMKKEKRVIVDKNPPDSGYLNGNEAQDYVWLPSWCEMCVLTKWNLRKWFVRRLKTMRVLMSACLIWELETGASSLHADLLRSVVKVNTVCCLSSHPLLILASPALFCLLYSTSNSCRHGEENEILTILGRVNEGEMTSIFFVRACLFLSPSPLRVDEQESGEQT